MVRKKIRGTVTTTLLDAGEEAEVEYTDQVKNLEENGYIEVVGDATSGGNGNGNGDANRTTGHGGNGGKNGGAPPQGQ